MWCMRVCLIDKVIEKRASHLFIIILNKFRIITSRSGSHLNDLIVIEIKSKTFRKSFSKITTVLSTLPILCIYPFVQKFFTQGVMVGSVKG